MQKLSIFYITNDSKEEAKKIANYLLEKKLIGCANIFQVNSVFPWENKIDDTEEFVLIAKTIVENKEKVNNAVAKIHPYDIPCILNFEVEVNQKYLDWICKNLNS